MSLFVFFYFRFLKIGLSQLEGPAHRQKCNYGMSWKMSSKPGLTQPPNQMEQTTLLPSSAKASVNAEAFCLVTGVNMPVCVGPTVGNNAKVYWGWHLIIMFLPFLFPATLIAQMGTEAKCASSTTQWREIFFITLITALQHLWKRQDLAFGLNVTPKCHKRGEN